MQKTQVHLYSGLDFGNILRYNTGKRRFYKESSRTISLQLGFYIRQQVIGVHCEEYICAYRHSLLIFIMTNKHYESDYKILQSHIYQLPYCTLIYNFRISYNMH